MKKKILLVPSILFLVSTLLKAQVSFIKECGLPYSGGPAYMKEANGKLFFGAYDASTGLELWTSDGTSAGTSMLMEINPGIGNGLHEVPNLISQNSICTVYNDEYYFLGYDDLHGEEIWKSDGTVSGTTMLKDISPFGSVTGPYYDNYPYFTIVNGTLFFQADDGNHGSELWKTDGTTAGTVMVKDIYSGFNPSEPSFLTAFNNEVFFRAWGENTGEEVWKSDGTDAGTQMVKDIRPGPYSCFYSNSSWLNPYFKVSGSYLYFVANIDSPYTNFHYWRTDGTAAGTIQLETFLANNGLPPSELDYTDVNGTFYFDGSDGNPDHSDFFKSDGSVSGTVNIATNNHLYANSNFYSFNNKLYFNGGDDNAQGLGVSDGTTSGTKVVAGFPGLASSPSVGPFATDGNFLYGGVLAAVNATSMETRLLQSNGTTAGTVRIPHYGFIGGLIPFNGKMYYAGYDTIINSTYQLPGLYSFTPINVGVNENYSEENFTVFPNPADQFVTYNLTGTIHEETTLKILDVNGKEILKTHVPGVSTAFNLSTATLCDGVYFLTIEGKNISVHKKILVQHEE